jgi:hypothetical protein
MVALDMLVKTESRRGNEPNGKVYLVSNGKSDFNPQDDELIEIMDMMCDHLKRKEILLTVLLVLLFLFFLFPPHFPIPLIFGIHHQHGTDIHRYL